MAQPNFGGMNHPKDDRDNHPNDDRNGYSFEQERYLVYWVGHILPPPAQGLGHFIFVDNRFVPMGNQGKKFQVTGDIFMEAMTFGVESCFMEAMTFGVESCKHPRVSDPTCWYEHIGWVLRENFETRITAVCDAFHPPPQQFNGTTPLFPGQPPRTCREWTLDVKSLLILTGVLEPLRASDQGGDPQPMARN